MQDEVMYPVCPHRNVPAAFQRFLGPDSGGMERFFPDARAQRADGTLLIVRLRRRRAVDKLQRALHAGSWAIDQFNGALSSAWSSTASACCDFASDRGKEATYAIGRTATLLFGSRPLRLPA